MKNNESNKLLKDKLHALDTLSGGIVYGKEEAWEKLQARLDGKPKKKRALWYWPAAAALVVILISLFFMDRKPEPMVAAGVPDTSRHLQVAPPASSAPVPQREMVQIKSDMARTAPKRKNVTVTMPPRDFVAVYLLPDAAVASPPKRDTGAALAAAPVPPYKMRVIHINELNSESNSAQALPIVAAGPALDIRNMPVVHINDVMQGAYYQPMLRPDTRLTLGKLFFLRQEQYEIYEPQTIYQTERKFKLRVN